MTEKEGGINYQVSVSDDNEIVRQFKFDIASGKHWFFALLEAMGRWTIAEETVGERTYRYLIGGEAFDWLALAERLCAAVKSSLPENDIQKLLFYGILPTGVTAGEFETFFGEIKYRQYLNFFYGVTAEEALFLSVQEEVRKDRSNTVINRSADDEDEVYNRIYGAGKHELLKKFRKENGYAHKASIGLTELKEFTYWLFKYRVAHCERPRVASDTRKAMDFLKEQYIKNTAQVRENHRPGA